MSTFNPPKYARKLLEWLITKELFDDVDGDLTEIYHDNIEKVNLKYARRKYLVTVLLSIRNVHLRRKLNYYNPLVMYKNYFKIAVRNLLKHKGYSFINIFGLAVGMASCLLILLFVNNELSFDGFHEKKASIYRLDEVQTFGAVSAQKVALTMFPMGPAMHEDFPEVVNFSRYWPFSNRPLVEFDDKQHYIETLARVDTSFLNMFDFPLIDGVKGEVFNDPNNIILSQTTAKRIFGDRNPLGEVLESADSDNQYKVVGIFEDVPDYSHLQFDALMSIQLWDTERRQQWGSNYLNTYVQLANGVDVAALESKFDDFLVRHTNERILEFYELFLQPLTDVHLGSMDITHDYNNHKKFARSSVNVFLMLAFFVLLIASINFMNLSTARAATRSREVGVRKSIGAFKSQITRQFIMESVLLSLMALIIGFGMCLASIDALSQIIDRPLDLGIYLEPSNLATILLVTLAIGFLSGIYPALVMSRFNPVLALKGNGVSGGKSIFRNVLVVFQYAIAITIIIGTSVATRQLNHMQTLDLGFDKDLVVVLDMFGDTNDKYDLLKGELEKQSYVMGVTSTSQRLGNNLHQTGMEYRADTALIRGSSSFVSVEHNFFEFYDMEIIDGRALSDEFADDMRGRSFIVNETLAKELGAGGHDVVGMPFHFGGADTLGRIVGVAKDFNYNKLNLRVEPLFMSRQPWGWSEVNVRLQANQTESGLDQIEAVWTNLFPNRPFQFSFLDAHIDQMYKSEQQLTKVISILSVLAIVIASLGLFGLASFIVRQRLKEMGIRKVLGASVSQIVMILSRKFTFLVILAFLIAAPVTYFIMQGWLDGYTYKIDIGILVFVIVGFGSWVIALLTVSAQSLRVAKTNPVETLRIE